jgi:hypothetical protein
MKKFLGLCLLLAFAACASDDKAEPSKDATPPAPEVKTENLICPQVAILKEADEAFDFGRENHDDANLVAKARLKGISGDCAYRKDEKKPTGIDISFTLNAVAARGPRLGGNQTSFPYFIAVVDPSDAVLSRQIVTAEFKFSGERVFAEMYDPLHVFIPIPTKDLTFGPDYRVLIGFIKQAP